jgi:hypothetical protein
MAGLRLRRADAKRRRALVDLAEEGQILRMGYRVWLDGRVMNRSAKLRGERIGISSKDLRLSR